MAAASNNRRVMYNAQICCVEHAMMHVSSCLASTSPFPSPLCCNKHHTRLEYMPDAGEEETYEDGAREGCEETDEGWRERDGAWGCECECEWCDWSTCSE